MANSLTDMQATLTARKAATAASADTNNPPAFRPRDPQEVNIAGIEVNQEIKVRLVEDGDTSNDFFWRVNSYHELFFKGVKGDDSKNNTWTIVHVPAYNTTVTKAGKMCDNNSAIMNVHPSCVYTNYEDPINVYVQQNKLFENKQLKMRTYKGEEKELYKVLGRRLQYLFQGFIVEAPENFKIYDDTRKLKHFRVTSDIMSIIERHVFNKENADMGDNPIDLQEGVDFILRKRQFGQYNNYDESTFSRKHTSAPIEGLQDLNQYGIDSIVERCYKKPSNEEKAVIQQMLVAFLGGLPYDPAWDTLGYNKYTRELGGNTNTNSEAPSWNTPQTSVAGSTSPVVAQEVTASMISEITGTAPIAQPVVQPVAQPVVTATPAPQPASVMPATASTNNTPEEVLAFLVSKNATPTGI